MKYFALFLGCFLSIGAAISAEIPDLIGEEIPLDDFSYFQQGFRIQAGAFSSESAARSWQQELQQIHGEDVSIRYEDSLWKVRIGFYPSDSASQLDLAHLKLKGYDNLNLVEDKIIPTIRQDVRTNRVEGYRIQVKALTDEAEALEYARKLNFDYTDIRSYVIKTNSHYKIQMGDFRTRQETETRLQEIKDSLDNGAWIVETLIYETPPPSPVERTQVDIFRFMD
ncbi:MAG: SPOR domain-containing protein [bacterium]